MSVFTMSEQIAAVPAGIAVIYTITMVENKHVLCFYHSSARKRLKCLNCEDFLFFFSSVGVRTVNKDHYLIAF